MKALDLYKFVNENNIEYHWIEGGKDVILFVSNQYLQEWNKLLGCHILDEEGIECTMKDGYLCFKMKDICEHFDTELSDIFKNESLTRN